jgi:hypothetical protein
MNGFVEFLFWLKCVAGPLILGLISGVFMGGYLASWVVFFIFASIGLLVGVVFAEWVRRKYGCSNFFSKVDRFDEIN